MKSWTNLTWIFDSDRQNSTNKIIASLLVSVRFARSHQSMLCVSPHFPYSTMDENTWNGLVVRMHTSFSSPILCVFGCLFCALLSDASPANSNVFVACFHTLLCCGAIALLLDYGLCARASYTYKSGEAFSLFMYTQQSHQDNNKKNQII